MTHYAYAEYADGVRIQLSTRNVPLMWQCICITQNKQEDMDASSLAYLRAQLPYSFHAQRAPDTHTRTLYDAYTMANRLSYYVGMHNG